MEETQQYIDLPHIEQIPFELTWEIRQKAMYPGESLETVKLAKDEEGIHFGLFDHDKLISVASWFRQDQTKAQFRKLATLEEYRGLGYGTELMKYLIDFSQQERIKILWGNGRVSALRFYKKLGFRETESHFQKGDIDYVIIQLDLL